MLIRRRITLQTQAIPLKLRAQYMIRFLTLTDKHLKPPVDLHPYYKKYLRKGILRPDVRRFYSELESSKSAVWVLDITAGGKGEHGKHSYTVNLNVLIIATDIVKSNGPFYSEKKLVAYIRDSTVQNVWVPKNAP